MAERLAKLEFIAIVPDVAHAVDFHGGGGVRIVLDISDKYKGAAAILATDGLHKKLKVTVEEYGGRSNDSSTR